MVVCSGHSCRYKREIVQSACKYIDLATRHIVESRLLPQQEYLWVFTVVLNLAGIDGAVSAVMLCLHHLCEYT